MNLRDLQIISEALLSLSDFAESNSDGDESGIAEEMAKHYNKAIKIVDHEKYKIYLRNAKAKIKRKKLFK